jgi:hypothetical protein
MHAIISGRIDLVNLRGIGLLTDTRRLHPPARDARVNHCTGNAPNRARPLLPMLSKLIITRVAESLLLRQSATARCSPHR